MTGANAPPCRVHLGYFTNEFEGMFEMMSKCCPGGSGLSDCHSMMNMMMEKCCGLKTKNTEADRRQK